MLNLEKIKFRFENSDNKSLTGKFCLFRKWEFELKIFENFLLYQIFLKFNVFKIWKIFKDLLPVVLFLPYINFFPESLLLKYTHDKLFDNTSTKPWQAEKLS